MEASKGRILLPGSALAMVAGNHFQIDFLLRADQGGQLAVHELRIEFKSWMTTSVFGPERASPSIPSSKPSRNTWPFYRDFGARLGCVSGGRR